MDSKIEKKLVELVKELGNEESQGKTYVSSYDSSGEDNNYSKKVSVYVTDRLDPECHNLAATIEYQVYQWNDASETQFTKQCYNIVTDKISMTVMEETSQKLWNALNKFMKKWNIDNLIEL